VLEIFPEAKIAIGPPIEDGFYYDFELTRVLTDEDLGAIEARMRDLLKTSTKFECREVTPEEGRRIFADQPYKLELIEDLLSGERDEYGEKVKDAEALKLTVYQHGNFVDLCRGPHVASTEEICPDAFKLLRTSGAYWRGDEHRQMLQRIYGTVWETKQDLEEYLSRLEEAKQRDHRLLGKQLDLFSFSDEVGPGLPLWHPKGALLRHLAEQFSKEAHLLNDYEWVITPHIGKGKLWETSGHLEFFRENMYRPMDIEGDEYFLKPMNCPFHIHIYRSQLRSYRQLPIKFAEFGTVYRYERSGVVSGLTRVRCFTQDDAHIFCTPEQVGDEILKALQFSLYVLRSFGLVDFKAYLATRPEGKSVGTPEEWERAQAVLEQAVRRENLPFEIDEGGGAFYGPKIDLKVCDGLKREWQLSTIQFDFNLPGRFGIEYTGADGQTHTPVMVHRALCGSFERFVGMLIEHYKGDFPLWLAPVQVRLIPIADAHLEYAYKLRAELVARNIRADVDDSNERMQAKIRSSELEKVPFAFIVGGKEMQNGTVSVRSRARGGDLGAMTLEDFMASISTELEAAKPRRLVDV
ncbi:MAG: threonine--tRNA ligase, partial [Deltaproteobacteria bacterium]|nr:threonine--tRNA ligase [Deltaproteobacteria bacterium]